MSDTNGKPKEAQPVNNPTADYLEMVANVAMSRQELMNRFLDPRRDTDKECGYLATSQLTATEYREMYDREPVAARVVELFPDECWSESPTVYESEDPEKETEFEKAWDEVSKNLLGGEESWYKTEKGASVWEYFHRADVMSGIGHFGVILLGFDDGKALNEPVEFKPGAVSRKLLFMRVFDESMVQITTYETDQNNPRFGQPVKYNVTLNDPNVNHSGIGLSIATVEVHWTRIIHLADNLLSSEISGAPRQRPNWNRLMDVKKVTGGSAEMYWRGAFPGLSIETHPQMGADITLDETSIKQQMSSYSNNLQRWLAIIGASVKSLAPQVVDPTAQIEAQIDQICIKLACPKRIFMGSERGELASSQDSRTWNRRLMFRQNLYLTPKVIVPFVNRLILVGVLPIPSEGFEVEWKDLNSLTDMEKATLAGLLTDALSKYVAGGVDVLIPPMDFLTRILGFEEVEALAIIEKAMEHILKANPEAEGEIVPGRNPPPPEPEPQPGIPIKMKEGETPVDHDGNPLTKNQEAGRSNLPFGMTFSGETNTQNVGMTPTTSSLPKILTFQLADGTYKSMGTFRSSNGELRGREKGGEIYYETVIAYDADRGSAVRKVRDKILANSGTDCGTGSGGFKAGNKCAKGSVGGLDSSLRDHQLSQPNRFEKTVAQIERDLGQEKLAVGTGLRG